MNFTSGKYYLIQLDVISCDVPNHIRIGSTASAVGYAANIWGSGEIGIGSHSILWLAPSDYTYLSIGGRNDMTTLVVDNVSVKEISVGEISGATWVQGVGAPLAQTSVIDWNKRILDKTNEFLIPQGLTAGRDLLGNQFENVRKQYALNLDGQSWAEVHDNESLDFGTGSFSLEAWVKAAYIDTGSSYNVILNLGNTLGGSAGLTSRSGYIAFFYGTSSLNYSTSNDGSWVHIVGTYDGTNTTIYANGVEESQTARTAINVSTDETKYIGKDSNITRIYKDQIAQPRIYNRALTADEVKHNYDVTNEKLFGKQLLLNKYPNAAAAYSLRLLDNTYSGNAIKVRRASDNTEQDIGFVNNELDTATLESFCSGTDGFVTTWYDQSGNANNATQATASAQPKIVSSGTSLGYIQNADGVTNYGLRSTHQYTATTDFSSFIVGRNYLGSANERAVFGGTASASFFYGVAQSGSSSNSYSPNFSAISYYADGSSIGTTRNDIHNATTSFTLLTTLAQINTSQFANLSYVDNSFNNSRIKEYIIYDNQTISRTGVENNIITHYGL